MKINKIKSRNIIFTYNIPDGWDLNLHLILGDKYNYIIDTGLGSLSILPVINYIKEDKKPTIVINTHFHWDHIWGNHMMGDSIIISHYLCRERMDQNWEDMLQKRFQYLHGETNKYLPNLTFENELYFPEDGIRILYTPGHTKDSISVLDEVDNVINAGDNIGDTMEELIPGLECEKSVYMETLKKYKNLDFEFCVSGHNTILKKEIFDKILEMIID
ncbi:MBL fold metallo-hydrolase [Anaerocolumna sedimenticola]|uniref:MBL fold metallo-hydrolase n=1 Tax=Anaerocolumna sedimenticola TaxID=2696063 RepID=A0A6P1TIY0_9FIRM|nr:MBL fold metallo-hydrolase [Anaerocolumna sedimenticola]QHQ60001.1 MBL fold metallo-hydrolase [Anaerocolumna sedimenticola]